MRRATVKWFNNVKGYSFLQEDGSLDDIFVHYSAIESEGFKTLREGDNVTFELIEGPKGLAAANVRPDA